MGPYDGLGGMDGVGVQVGRQLAEICAISSYSFVVTCILLYGLKFIPGMHLRVSNEAEMMGLDADQFCNDEQIGDWSMFEQHAYEANVSGASSQHTPAAVPAVNTKQA
jgi:Amt family ammonium transporter